MTPLMERNQKTPLLFLLLALLHVFDARAEDCPSDPNDILKDLACTTDYDRRITCVWNSTYVSDHPDSVCTINTTWEKGSFGTSSCTLEPVEGESRLKTCILIYRRDENFVSHYNLSMNLTCNPGKHTLKMFYKPACHIKLNPPQQPNVNFTTVSWHPIVKKRIRIQRYLCELQWKQEDQSWSDLSVQKNSRTNSCTQDCVEELMPDQLIQGKVYKARIRVKVDGNYQSTWSDWSPTASWVTRIDSPSAELSARVLAFVAVAAAFAVFLVVLRLKTDKTIWVYIVKRIRGPPLPDPANSFLQDANFQSWLSPHFTGDFLHSHVFKAVEIVSTVDAVAPNGPEAALQQKIRSEVELISNNFSNPSYSQLCAPPPPPPPISSLTAGNLPPCVADAPYGPVCGHSEGRSAEQERDAVLEIQQLLSKGRNNSEDMMVISDYEKAERLQLERVRLQSLDSGVCSGEEISQESLEADSITVAEGEEERETGGGDKVDFHKLFGGGGGMQVCSDYECVHQTNSPDSGVSSGVEEQLEDVDKSTGLLLPPPLCTLPCSSSITPLFFSGPGVSPAPRPHLLERTALMSTGRSVEPSGDGYMPVRQEES